MSRSWSPLLVDLLAAAFALADAHLDLLAVLALVEAVPDAGRQLARRADEHHVRRRHGRRALDAPAGRDLRAAHAARVADRPRLLVLRLQVQVLDDDLPVARERLEDPPLLAAVLAGEHLDGVTFLEFQRCHVLEHLGSQADDLHEVLLTQLAGDRPEDARPARVAGCVDDHCGVLVERDQRSVVATEGLLRAHDDGLHHFALLDRALRGRSLDARRDDVADTRVAALRAARNADAE